MSSSRGEQSPRPTWRRDTTYLTVSSVLGGLSAYGFILVGTRVLGAADFAPVSVLWTFWAVAAAALTFPVQHWVIRTVEGHPQGERQLRGATRSLARLAMVAVLLFGTTAWWAREALFLGPGIAFPAMAAVVPLGAVAMGVARGHAAGRRKFLVAGLLLGGENVVRFLAAAVAAMISGGSAVFGIAILSGYVLAVPSLWGVFRGPSSAAPPSPVRGILGVSGGTAIGQFVLTGGPAVLAAMGGQPAEVTSFFAVLAVFRAIYSVGTGVSTRLTGPLTSLASSNRPRLRRLTTEVAIAALLLGSIGGVLGAWIGPRLLPVVFGPDVTLSGRLLGMLAAGNLFALASLIPTLMVVVSTRTASIAFSWAIGAGVGAALLVVPGGSPVERVSTAFFGATLVALGVLLVRARASVGEMT